MRFHMGLTALNRTLMVNFLHLFVFLSHMFYMRLTFLTTGFVKIVRQ